MSGLLLSDGTKATKDDTRDDMGLAPPKSLWASAAWDATAASIHAPRRVAATGEERSDTGRQADQRIAQADSGVTVGETKPHRGTPARRIRARQGEQAGGEGRHTLADRWRENPDGAQPGGAGRCRDSHPSGSQRSVTGQGPPARPTGGERRPRPAEDHSQLPARSSARQGPRRASRMRSW